MDTIEAIAVMWVTVAPEALLLTTYTLLADMDLHICPPYLLV